MIYLICPLDDLDHDVSDLSIRGVECSIFFRIEPFDTILTLPGNSYDKLVFVLRFVLLGGKRV